MDTSEGTINSVLMFDNGNKKQFKKIWNDVYRLHVKVFSFFPGFKISQLPHRHVCMLNCRNSLEIQDLCHSITICAKEAQKYQEFKQAIEKISSKGMLGKEHYFFFMIK